MLKLRVNGLYARGVDFDIATEFVKYDWAKNKDKILETAAKNVITTQYAFNDSWYGPETTIRFEVIGERNRFPGQQLVGITGAEGYHVPEADRSFSLKLKGYYCVANPNPVWVKIHKFYRVPRKMEELICVETQLNAISPIVHRESPQRCWNQDQEMHRTYQFEVVAWESRKDLHNGSTMWRMGYVMNDLGTCLRVMIPNGRLYILNQERVVRFDFAGELLRYGNKGSYVCGFPDSNFLPESEIHRFADDDWEYGGDLEWEIAMNRSMSVKFVKDKSYPRQKKRKRQMDIKFEC